MPEPRASDHFGGIDAVRTSVIATIRARKPKDISPAELAEYADLKDPGLADAILNGHPERLCGTDAFAMLATCLIPLNDVLPAPKLTKEEVEYWQSIMDVEGSGPLRARGVEVDRRLALEAYLRMRAIDELRDELLASRTTPGST
jgi:hypothetical protein